MASIPANQPLGGGFDVARWISDWSEHGGILILTNDHLYLRRPLALPLTSTTALDRLRVSLIRDEGGQAIVDHLARRRDGDI